MAKSSTGFFCYLMFERSEVFFLASRYLYTKKTPPTSAIQKKNENQSQAKTMKTRATMVKSVKKEVIWRNGCC